MNGRVLSPSPSRSAGAALRILLIAAALVAGSLWPATSHAQIADEDVDAFVEALRLAAPNTGIKNDGLYSDWKIKEDNIVRWSKRCTGRTMTSAEFSTEPQNARAIIACIMGKILREQYEISRNKSVAVRRAASWWMTGAPEQYDAPGTKDYTEKVLGYFREAP